MHVTRNLINGYVGLLKSFRDIALALVAQLRAYQQRKNRAGNNRKQHGSHQQFHQGEPARAVLPFVHINR
jgi:hypothetical protein